MGAFRYCVKCGRALERPSPLEDLIEGQGCPDCDTCQPNIFTKEEWIIQTFDEIEELKKRISKQEAKIKLLRGIVRRLKKK